jgi:hypothetical protein
MKPSHQNQEVNKMSLKQKLLDINSGIAECIEVLRLKQSYVHDLDGDGLSQRKCKEELNKGIDETAKMLDGLLKLSHEAETEVS